MVLHMLLICFRQDKKEREHKLVEFVQQGIAQLTDHELQT